MINLNMSHLSIKIESAIATIFIATFIVMAFLLPGCRQSFYPKIYGKGITETESKIPFKDSGVVIKFDNRSTPRILLDVANFYGMKLLFQKGFDTNTRVATGEGYFSTTNLEQMLFNLESDSVHFQVIYNIIYVKR